MTTEHGCGAIEATTGRRCVRSKHHPGPHESHELGLRPLTWEATAEPEKTRAENLTGPRLAASGKGGAVKLRGRLLSVKASEARELHREHVERAIEVVRNAKGVGR